MTRNLKSKINHAHALASALQIVVFFTERPGFLGGSLSIDEAITEIVRQGSYKVTAAELHAEIVRLQLL